MGEAFKTAVSRGGFASKVVATVATVLLTSACANFLPSHIHDAAAEKTALDLQTRVAQYREDQSGLYDNMNANLALFIAEEDELINRMAANFTTALVTGAPDYTWNDVIANLGRVGEQAGSLRKKVKGKIEIDLKQRDKATTDLANAKEAIKALNVEINKEKKNAEKWQKAAERYREAMARLPGTVEGLAEKANDVSSLLSDVEVLDAELREDLKRLEINPEDFLKGIKDTNDSLRRQLSTGLQEAPGLTVLILELGLEFAELDKRRTESKLAYLEERRNVFEDTLVYLDVADRLLSLGDSFVISDDYTRSLMDEIEEIKTDDGGSTSTKVGSVTGVLFALRFSVSADWIVEYQNAVFPLRLARIEHSQSIIESQVNDATWQALLDSGIDALVAYHKGGLKKDDLANFFRLAQSVALFIIAA